MMEQLALTLKMLMLLYEGALQSVTEEASVEDNTHVARPRVQHGR